MVPLYLQLESRYRDLEEIRESLWNLDGEVLTYEMVEHLSIDFHHVDIDTGATSDSVTPYFLPRSSFPSCRDMSGDLMDWMFDAGQDRATYGKALNPPIIPRFFPAALQLTHENYACEMSEDLYDLISNWK
ncbi:hypothetical protein PENVUL_c002G06247 [Penicillium vulpinum]|uniref:Uncharacterized protein n=2 Tax=Penicillium vulpinum TaxID=29845 RepID=A0A1V6SCW5_9EURO|nr:hypothetical protein PENVUL_c002G06247 [Penicillium vulpinum]